MKLTTAFLFLLVSLTAFSQKSNDSTEIVYLLMDDYKTLGNWDLKRHIDNCTADYLLVEKGEIMSLEDEADYFKKNQHRIIERKDTFKINNVHIKDNSAYAAYYLKSRITENGNSKMFYWVESAVFRKVNSKWKIALIHSTEVKQW